MSTEEKKLLEAQNKYESAIRRMSEKIASKIRFKEFSIQWQPSDGWTIVDACGNVAPFGDCMEVIKKHRFLSWEAFRSLRI